MTTTLQVSKTIIAQPNQVTQVADMGSTAAASTTMELINTSATEAEVTVYISNGAIGAISAVDTVLHKVKLNPNGGSYLRDCALMASGEKIFVTSTVGGVVSRVTALKESV